MVLEGLVLADRPDLVDNQALKLVRRYRGAGAALVAVTLGRTADVVLVSPAALARGAGDPGGPTGTAGGPSTEQEPMHVAGGRAARATVLVEQGLDILEQVGGHDPVVLAVVDLVPAGDSADVDRVCQEPPQRGFRERSTAALVAVPGGPGLQCQAALRKEGAGLLE